ncbi:hypothetical protein APASM_5181 [Actinosynnema pretiosum subsp. pretiosum]|nr:hypothetical protein APASM_5181 [Actinosynnema pretiosum subsp. pretiosum]
MTRSSELARCLAHKTIRGGTRNSTRKNKDRSSGDRWDAPGNVSKATPAPGFTP